MASKLVLVAMAMASNVVAMASSLGQDVDQSIPRKSLVTVVAKSKQRLPLPGTCKAEDKR